MKSLALNIQRLVWFSRTLPSLLAACVALWVIPAGATSPSLPTALKSLDPSASAVPAAPEVQSQDLKAKRDEIAQRLAAAQKSLDAIDKDKTAAGAAPPENLSREIELLKELDVLYAQLQSADENRKQLEAAKAELDQKLSDLRRDGPAEKQHTFSLLDSLRDSLSTEQSRMATMAAAVSAATDALARAKSDDDKEQADRRHAKEAADRNKDNAKVADLTVQLKLAELEARVSQETVTLRRLELDNAKAEQQASQLRLNLLRETLAVVEKDSVFTEGDLRERMAEIEKQEQKLHQSLTTAQSVLKFLEQQWADARTRLDGDKELKPAVKEEEATTALARDCQNDKIALRQKQLEHLGPVKEAWQRRFAAATGRATRAELVDWAKETAGLVEQLGLERRLEELTIQDERAKLADLDKRLETARHTDPDLAQAISREQTLYRQIIDSRSDNLVKLEQHRKLFESVSREIGSKTAQISFADAWAIALQGVVRVWTCELMTSEDRSVTVGKVLGCIVLVVFGVFISRRLAKAVAGAVLPRLGIHHGAAAAIQSLAFYGLVITSVLMALHMVNVPLTVFTFMGGAVAIGVGFGSQNILNNFISGVIMLIERPVRVGDIIEIGSLMGTVEAIGTRSTRIRTGTNSEIIVPNSTFLESNVINWTLTDSTLRTCVRVGLAYGSPTRDVARWLKRAADEHGLVLKKPEPFVWFSDFGESSLVFELHFWIDVAARADRRRVESDLRFMIDQYFREAGIIIAFPQREMHLHSAQPLEICLRQPERKAALESEASSRAA